MQGQLHCYYQSALACKIKSYLTFILFGFSILSGILHPTVLLLLPSFYKHLLHCIFFIFSSMHLQNIFWCLAVSACHLYLSSVFIKTTFMKFESADSDQMWSFPEVSFFVIKKIRDSKIYKYSSYYSCNKIFSQIFFWFQFYFLSNFKYNFCNIIITVVFEMENVICNSSGIKLWITMF